MGTIIIIAVLAVLFIAFGGKNVFKNSGGSGGSGGSSSGGSSSGGSSGGEG